MASSVRGGFLRDDTTGALIVSSPAADRDNGQQGMIAPMGAQFGNQTNLALTQSRAYLSRFVPSRSLNVVSVAFSVTVAATLDDAVQVGIYDRNYQRLAASAQTTGLLNSIGVKSVALSSPLVLAAGQTYYAALVQNSTAGTVCQMLAANFITSAAELFGTGAGVRETAFQGPAFPLPTTLAPSAAISQIPLMAIREF